MSNFYDNLAKKLGGYGFAHDGLEYRSEYSTTNPEEDFYNAVIEASGLNKTALDIGCGDGIFSFRVASSFAQINGLDNSKELIRIAKEKQKELKIDNAVFEYGDAYAIPYGDLSFDVAFNRRGPSFYKEYARVLKPGGIYIEIGIGEQDTRELKEVFGRGQNYGDWDTKRIDRDVEEFNKCGLGVIKTDDYLYKEYYPSRKMFEIFLEGVPIFEDFDKAKDAKLLETYISSNATDNGEISLNRHRVLYILRKNNT